MPKNLAGMNANRTERNNRWILYRRKFGHQRRIQGQSFPSARNVVNRPPSAPQGHIAKAYQLLVSVTLVGCAVLLAVIEGVGIGFQKMFAGSTKLEMPQPPPSDGAMV
ncbi:hypothetical protein COL940_012754 [Colletotrichum noveboracense]|nr:hypothetical protein COL940_012754 [Colletotrichum noveboracense]KAJ0273560.1 hypothetical protein CBS470a_012207 [Colletotrichum nupharicola]